MLHNFGEVLEKVQRLGRVVISVAAAQDKDVLKAIKAAADGGLVEAILVGDSELIRPLAEEVGLPADIRIVHEPDVKQAALTAVSLVNKGEAEV